MLGHPKLEANVREKDGSNSVQGKSTLKFGMPQRLEQRLDRCDGLSPSLSIK